MRSKGGPARKTGALVGIPRAAASPPRSSGGTNHPAMRKPPPHVAPLIRGADGAARPSLPIQDTTHHCAPLTPPHPPFSFPHMSGLPFELLLALRYLRPKRTF